MHCAEKNILKFFALLITLNFCYSFQQTSVQNVTSDRYGRVLWSKLEAKDPLMARLKQEYLASLAIGLSAIACNFQSVKDVKTCKINVKTLDPSHALILEPFDRTEFRYPDDKGYINFFNGEPIFLSCPGKDNWLNTYPNPKYVLAMCVCDQKFAPTVGDYREFSEFTCKRPPESTIVFKGNYGRQGVFSKYEVGFYTEKSYFVKLMSIHYDSTKTSTMYVQSVISKSIAGGQRTAKNRRFDQEYCCESLSLNMDTAYKADVQDESFGNQMKCHAEKTCSYLDKSKEIIFTRGHLTPKSTFVYTSAGIATFRYVNTAPQWKPINDGNWARMEEHITELATKLKKDLVTITGVLGSLKLADTSDSNIEKFIHLYDKDNLRAMQVPLYFYKLVYEPHSNRGIVYVSVNNPFIKDNWHEYHICSDPMVQIIGGKIPPKWKPKFANKGYSYICEVSDFLKFNGLKFDDLEIENLNGLLYEGMADSAIHEVETDTMEVHNDIDDKPGPSHQLPRDELRRSMGS